MIEYILETSAVLLAVAQPDEMQVPTTDARGEVHKLASVDTLYFWKQLD